MPKQERSELECFIIGLLWQLGPSSAYDLRVHMRASPSTQWSASAGAIYPLLQRLEAQGLLTCENTHKGKRPRSVYTPTEDGLRALRAWIGPPLARDAATVAHDPLRSRARFLGVLTPAARRKWLVAARAALDEVEQQIIAWERSVSPKDTFAAHMTRCGELDLEARRRWITELDERLDHAPARRAKGTTPKRGTPQRTRSGSGKSR